MTEEPSCRPKNENDWRKETRLARNSHRGQGRLEEVGQNSPFPFSNWEQLLVGQVYRSPRDITWTEV